MGKNGSKKRKLQVAPAHDTGNTLQLVPFVFEDPDFFGMPLGDSERAEVTLSRVRVQLNQPLSWGEAEDLTHRGFNFEVSVNPQRTHVTAEGPMNSRQMFAILRKVLADNYVNLFPRAVKTESEYSGPSSR